MPESTPRSRSNRAQAAGAAQTRASLPIAPARLGPEAQAVLLEQIAMTGDLPLAAKSAGTTTAAVRARLRTDEVFAAAMQEAWDDFKDGPLMKAARDRAITGIEEGIYYRGEPARDEDGKPAKIRKYSDALLLRLLEVLDPRFRPHSVQETRQAGPQAADLDNLSPEARAHLEAFLDQRASDTAPKDEPPAAPPPAP